MTNQHDETSRRTGTHQRTPRSARRGLATLLKVAAVLFMAEFAVMNVLPLLRMHGIWENLADSAVLTILALPALYLLGFRSRSLIDVRDLRQCTRVEKRMLLVLFAQLAMVMTIVAVYGLLATSQESGSRVINLAGQQRMHSQRLVKSAMLEAMELARAEMTGSEPRTSGMVAMCSVRCQRDLRGLIEGDAEFGLPPCPSDEAARQLEVVLEASKPFWALVQQTGEPSDMDEASDYYVALDKAGERVLIEMDKAVEMLEDHYEARAKLLSSMLGLAITIAVVISVLLAVTFVQMMRHRRRLDAELLKTNADLLSVNQVHMALFDCQSASEVSRTLTDALVEKLDAYFARVWLIRPGDLCSQCALAESCPTKERCLHLIASSGHYTHIDGDHRRVPLGAFKIGLIAQGRGKTISNDVVNDERVHDQQWAAKHGLRSFAGFPLVQDGEVIGVMALFSKRELPPHLLETLDLLAQLGVSAIANVTNLESIQEAKEQVTQQNGFLNTVIESLPYPFLVIDAEDHSVRMANASARCDAPDEPRASARADAPTTCHAMTHLRDTPCDGADHQCPLAVVKQIGKPAMAEHVHCEADGSPRTIEVHAYPVFDESNRVVQVIEYFLDITERKQAEEQQRRLVRAVESAAEAIIITDKNGQIVQTNPAFSRITGYSDADVIGKTPRILKSDLQPPEFYEQMWNTITTGQMWSGRLVNRRKDGTFYNSDLTVAPIISEGEEVTAYVGVHRNVTEQVVAEAELAAAKNQAEKALHDLEQIHGQLLQSEKMASIGQLAAGVAHEINNPIGFISSNLNSLAEYSADIENVLKAHVELLGECQAGGGGIGEKVRAVQKATEECDLEYIMSDLSNLIKESTEGAQRVRQIVADLRDFSHVDSPDVAEEDLNKLLDKTINVAWNELKYKTEVIREYGEIPVIPCYGGKLGQVFLNLLVNAAQAIEEHGTITVRTGLDDDRVWIEVADTGCGIPPEHIKRVFDPFFTTKDVGKGTGMGLNLAYKIIEGHSGRITIQSTVGKGTTVRIELPLIGPPEAEAQETQDVSIA